MPVSGTVVIVTYNALKIIARCLDSLKKDVESGYAKVVIVDNASTDGTAEYIATEFPWVKLVRNKCNGGFGAGNNSSREYLEGDWCFFLNPDAKINKGCLKILAEFLESNPKAGCIGPAILDQEGKRGLSYFPFTTLLTSIWSAVGLNRVLPFNRTNGRLEVRKTPPVESVIVDRVLGAAMMVPSRLFEQVDGYDERFFLYSEEEDLCLRIWKSGYKVVYLPAAETVHIGGDTTRQMKPLSTASANWSRYLFMRKHHSALEAEISRWVWLAAIAVRYIITLVAVWKKGRRDILRGYGFSILSLLSRDYFEKNIRPSCSVDTTIDRSA